MKRKEKRRAVAQTRASARVPGRQTAVALLLLLGDLDRRVRTREVARRLGAASSSGHQISCILARERLLDLSVRGWIALGSVAAALGTRRDEMLRSEDERRLAPRRNQLARAPGASYAVLRIARAHKSRMLRASAERRNSDWDFPTPLSTTLGERRSSIASNMAQSATRALYRPSPCGTRGSAPSGKRVTSKHFFSGVQVLHARRDQRTDPSRSRRTRNGDRSP